MSKKIISLVLSLFMIISLVGCGEKYEKHTSIFLNTFDTVIQITAYTKSQEEFDKYYSYAQSRFTELSKMYDKFYAYEGINNIYTINKNAGKEPIKVDKEIIDLLQFSKEQYAKTNGMVNIAMGRVLSIWQEFISDAHDNKATKLPTEEELQKANEYSNIDAIIVNEDFGTVFIDNKYTQIDVGAVAKGYATQLVTDELKQMGLKHFFINAGGNTVVGDKPLDGVHSKWTVGIQNPDAANTSSENQLIDAVVATNQSIVTSGDYQRFVMFNDERIHHIISGETLFPANHYRSVSIVTEDSGLADIYSTALFCMELEDGQKFAQENNLKVMWVMPNGEVIVTDSLVPLLVERGNANNKL